MAGLSKDPFETCNSSTSQSTWSVLLILEFNHDYNCLALLALPELWLLILQKNFPCHSILANDGQSDDPARRAITAHRQGERVDDKSLTLLLAHSIMVRGIAVSVNIRRSRS